MGDCRGRAAGGTDYYFSSINACKITIFVVIYGHGNSTLGSNKMESGYTGWIHAGRVEAGLNGRNYVWVMENEYWKEGLLVRRGRTQSDEYTRHDEACAGLTMALAGAVKARGGEVG